MEQQSKPTVEPLPHIKGMRTWVTEPDELPQAAATLLQAANRRHITPIAMHFEPCERQWAVVLIGDD